MILEVNENDFYWDQFRFRKHNDNPPIWCLEISYVNNYIVHEFEGFKVTIDAIWSIIKDAMTSGDNGFDLQRILKLYCEDEDND